MNKINKIIAKFVNDAAGIAIDEPITIRSNLDEFCASALLNVVFVPKWKSYKFNKNSLGDVLFREYFYSLSSYAKEFSLETISILHELGHIVTDSKLPLNYDRDKALDDITEKAKNEEELNRLYFRMTDEKMATLWAVKWLTVKKNRELAHKFEKEFFKNFAG